MYILEIKNIIKTCSTFNVNLITGRYLLLNTTDYLCTTVFFHPPVLYNIVSITIVIHLP